MLWKSLGRRRARVMLALLAVALGVGVTTALATLSLRVGDELARELRAAGPNFVVLPAGARWALDMGGATIEPARAGFALSESTVARLKTTFWKNNVLEAAPELEFDATLDGTKAPLVGSWFDRAVAIEGGTWRTGLSPLRPHWPVAGRWPREDESAIVLGRALAVRLGAASGDTLVAATRGGGASVVVSGIVDAGGLDDEKGWVPLALAQRLSGRTGEIDRVLMSALVLPESRMPAPDPRREPAAYEKFMCSAYPANVAKEIGEHLANADVLPMTEVVAGEASVVRRLNRLMLLLALAALTASTLGLLSTTTATVVERATEFGLMRALGATSAEIATLLLSETLLVSLAGGVFGWLLGGLAAGLIQTRAFAAPIAGVHAFAEPLLLPLALVLAIAVALLGTLVPLRVALRLDPVEVLHA